MRSEAQGEWNEVMDLPCWTLPLTILREVPQPLIELPRPT